MTRDRPLEVALIVLSRYLERNDPDFGDYLVQAYRHAEAAGVTPTDLTFLRQIAEAIGRKV